MNNDPVPEQTRDDLLLPDVSDEALETAAAPIAAAATGDPITRSVIC
jgi:hypothetical protein